MRKIFIPCALALSAIALSSVAIAAPRTERVAFAKGASSKVIKGTIKGYDYVDYVIGARGGQLLTVNLTTNRGSNYFNIMAKGNELTGAKRKLFFWAVDLAEKYDNRVSGGTWYNIQLAIANKLIFFYLFYTQDLTLDKCKSYNLSQHYLQKYYAL